MGWKPILRLLVAVQIGDLGRGFAFMGDLHVGCGYQLTTSPELTPASGSTISTSPK
jgi:hypothetical protein